ncbi:hypothetical protein OESDEN_10424 [Oesophagostomum dentatum]|uniref:Choline/ethanolamine kinase n=1 Tax=Oesophagostomum dentatum TaxID=61180 RepID=A0A0B1T0R0_OESDE|nr:hypothetical protein OESDEN_10424 [Oesophagostomum dentatum]
MMEAKSGYDPLDHSSKQERNAIQKSHDEIFLRGKILSLCADVLGGIWTKLQPNHVSVTRLRGGLTNLVYLVARPKFSASDDQPVAVLLRIQSQTNYDKLLNELVVFTTLAGDYILAY